MSFLSGTRAQMPSERPESEELNLTPIMNMFLILIPFLVSVAVFTHAAIIQVSLPSDVTAGKGAGPKKKDLKLTVVLAADGYSIALGDSLYAVIPDKQGRKDTDSLHQMLDQFRPGLLNQEALVVAVRDGIPFDDVVGAMDAGRSAGFSRLSLSGSAP